MERNELRVEDFAQEIIELVAEETGCEPDDYNAMWDPLVEFLKERAGKTIVE